VNLPTTGKRVLFCRSGGGAPGIQAHAGMFAALSARNIFSTHCHGTSAGGWISAFDASGHGSFYCRSIVEDLHDRDIRGEVPFWKLRAFFLDAFMRHEPIKELLADYLPLEWSQLVKPLPVYVTNTHTGLGEAFTGNGPILVDAPIEQPKIPLQSALLATSSISGVWPAVVWQGWPYCDGGTWNNCALPSDWWTFDEVWLLIATGRTDPKAATGGIVSRLMRNLFYFGRGQIAQALRTLGMLGHGAEPTIDAANIREIFERGWAWRNVQGDNGRTVRVRMLWPGFTDRGALHFVPGLVDRVEATAEQALFEMAQEGAL
jgi:predicted acylesterase/phospholipase RssA